MRLLDNLFLKKIVKNYQKLTGKKLLTTHRKLMKVCIRRSRRDLYYYLRLNLLSPRLLEHVAGELLSCNR